MDFTQPEEIAAAAASVRRFAEAEILPVIDGYEERHEFPHPIIEKMGAAGFFGAAFPDELGGSDMGYLAVAAIAEELSRLAPEFGYAMNMQAMAIGQLWEVWAGFLTVGVFGHEYELD